MSQPDLSDIASIKLRALADRWKRLSFPRKRASMSDWHLILFRSPENGNLMWRSYTAKIKI